MSSQQPTASTPALKKAEIDTKELTAAQLESLFMHNLSECNRMAKTTDVMTREVAMAKMLNYCIRMLHSEGWLPRTVVRTMVLLECGAGGERSIKGTMFQALRERRDETRSRVKGRESERAAGGGSSNTKTSRHEPED